MGRKLIIDFSAFTARGKKVIVKELTVIDVESQCVQHMVFKPPNDSASVTSISSDGRHYNWMSMHYNGLDFYEGSADYSSLNTVMKYLCMDADLIFAPSHEKASWLESEIFDKTRVVFNLQQFGCNLYSSSSTSLWFPADDDKHQCLLHRLRAPGFYCTQSIVKALATWCNENRGKIDMNLSSNRVKTFTNWPMPKPTPYELAAQGFVKFTSCDDMTRCVYCGIDLLRWQEEDIPSNEHKKYSPFCDVVRDKRNSPARGEDEVDSVDSFQCDCSRCVPSQSKEDRNYACA